MNRRSFMAHAGLFAGATLLPQQAWLRGLLPTAVNYQVLRRNVGYFTERGGTIACLLTPEHSVVVDTQFPEQAGHLLEKIRETNTKPIDLLINTHHHGDHTAGNIAFKGLVDMHVAHANSLANQERVAKANDKLAQTLLPTTTFTDQWSKKVGDEMVSLHYFGPGHTDGDAMVHFEEANVVHTGDLLFNRRFPYIDKSAGADIGNWIDVLRSARRKFDKDTIYVFGHAGENYPITGTAADLKAMAHFLKMSLRHVKKLKRKGETLEGALANVTKINGAPEWKGGGIERVLKAAWEEV